MAESTPREQERAREALGSLSRCDVATYRVAGEDCLAAGVAVPCRGCKRTSTVAAVLVEQRESHDQLLKLCRRIEPYINGGIEDTVLECLGDDWQMLEEWFALVRESGS